MEHTLYRLGRASARHPWRTIGGWLLAAVALIVLGQATSGTFGNDFRFPGSEAQQTSDLVRAHFPAYGAAEAEIVFAAEDGDVADRRTAIDATLAAISDQPGVTAVGELTTSPDNRVSSSTIRYAGQVGDLGKEPYRRLEAAADTARSAGLQVEFRGLVIDAATEPTTGVAELVGLGAALVVLLIAFGSVVAAGLPIAIAIVGLIVGTALVLLTGSVVDIPTSAPIIAVMLGMGAGIDYALFVVTRFRRALAAPAGASGPERVARAAGTATATAGHAVLFAGGMTSWWPSGISSSG
ncbi:MAG: MMPL family transporter [Dactylosporangium sp.]|nr:MMPL family transporter [Dactylosporangium sp.]NNJ60268.1 MMPL family transporter [Dactylosporangium sp.]